MLRQLMAKVDAMDKRQQQAASDVHALRTQQPAMMALLAAQVKMQACQAAVRGTTTTAARAHQQQPLQEPRSKAELARRKRRATNEIKQAKAQLKGQQPDQPRFIPAGTVGGCVPATVGASATQNTEDAQPDENSLSASAPSRQSLQVPSSNAAAPQREQAPSAPAAASAHSEDAMHEWDHWEGTHRNLKGKFFHPNLEHALSKHQVLLFARCPD